MTITSTPKESELPASPGGATATATPYARRSTAPCYADAVEPERTEEHGDQQISAAPRVRLHGSDSGGALVSGNRRDKNKNRGDAGPAPNRHAVRSVDPLLYGHIAEAHGLTWEDDFFDEDPESNNGNNNMVHASPIVAVFDFDREGMERNYTTQSLRILAAVIAIVTIYVVVLIFFIFRNKLALLALPAVMALIGPFHLRRAVQRDVRSLHAAVTRDGIAYVRDRRPSWWGVPCWNVGRSCHVVSFDYVTDCTVVEPLCGPAPCSSLVLRDAITTVHVESTARRCYWKDSENKNQIRRSHMLTVRGLRDPAGFTRLVWAMQREYRRARSQEQRERV
jgi:energy-converting hydrogenase Eha subunit E